MSRKNFLLTFKPLSREDLEYIRVLRNHNRSHFLMTKVIGPTLHSKWYKKYKLNCCDVVFIAKSYHDNERYGMLSIYDLDMYTQTCKIGRFIVEKDMRGFGIGKRMAEFAIDFAEKVFKVHKIHLEVRESNKVAHNLYKSLGFKDTRIEKRIIYMERQVSWR